MLNNPAARAVRVSGRLAVELERGAKIDWRDTTREMSKLKI
jgi:hypothetical protein